MNNLLLVAIGGALGSSCRYLFTISIAALQHGSSYPFGTLLVNIIGSFLIGILHFFASSYLESFSPQMRLILITGFLGGFTTFSAFSLDVFRLINAGQIGLATAYAICLVVFSILAIFSGFYIAKIIF